MPRPEKVQAVEEIKERFENAEATFLTEYRGLTVSEQQQLRRGLRAADAEYKVVKMSLARLAAVELGLEEFTESMMGPTAIAFANTDPAPVAKVLKDFAKDHEHLVLKFGLMAGELLPPEQVSKLADIEPRPVLLGKIAGAAKAPLAKMAGMLGSFLRDSASVFSQLLEKKEASEPTPADEAEAPAPAEAVAVADAPAEDTEEAAAEVQADETAGAEDAKPEADVAVEGDEPAAAVDETPEAEAEVAEAEEGSEEEPESADEADSDSDSDEAAAKAEEE